MSDLAKMSIYWLYFGHKSVSESIWAGRMTIFSTTLAILVEKLLKIIKKEPFGGHFAYIFEHICCHFVPLSIYAEAIYRGVQMMGGTKKTIPCQVLRVCRSELDSIFLNLVRNRRFGGNKRVVRNQLQLFFSNRFTRLT